MSFASTSATGAHAEHAAQVRAIRMLERESGRPIGILMDLQGPKLRVGLMVGGAVELAAGSRFRLDLSDAPGDATRAPMPHPEIFQALSPDTDILLDDGKIRLRVTSCGADFAETEVITGGKLSDRKGVNVPQAMTGLTALTRQGPCRPSVRPRPRHRLDRAFVSSSAPRTWPRRAS